MAAVSASTHPPERDRPAAGDGGRVSFPALLLLGAVCTSPGPPTTALAEGSALHAAERATLVVLPVDIRLAPILDGRTYLPEQAGLVLALVEASLADLPGVVPRIEGVPAAPGLEHALDRGEPRWRLSMRVDPGPIVGARLCEPDGRCQTRVVSAGADGLERTAADLSTWLASGLGRGAWAQPDVWARPQSQDRYAAFVAGRAAAAWYGLLPLPPVAVRGDPQRDPIARAIHLDPTMSIAQWISGRSAPSGKPRQKALLTAASLRPESAAFAAGAARARTEADPAVGRGAWVELLASTDDDPRFVIPSGLAALDAGWTREAEQVARLARRTWGPRLDVTTLEIALATAEGEEADDDVLADWQAAAPHDPEPVRRRLDARVARGALDEALELAKQLAARGAREEAAAIVVALVSATGDGSRAPTASAARADHALERRLDGRAPTLPDLQDRLKRAEALLGESRQAAAELARLQHLWATADCAARGCDNQLRRDLIDATRMLGQQARHALQSTRAETRVAWALAGRPTVGPLIDPRTRDRLEHLDLGVAHAVGRWSAAAAWNARYIEPEAWRLRVGPRDPSP